MSSPYERLPPSFHLHKTGGFQLTESQRTVLRSIVQAFAPALTLEGNWTDEQKKFFATSALDLGVDKEVEKILGERVAAETRTELLFVVDRLNTSFGTFLLTGFMSSFPSLAMKDRVKILNDWAQSPITAKRKLFRSFKTMSLVLFMTILDPNGRNPAWGVMGYPGSDPNLQGVRDEQFQFKMEDHATLPATLECDAVIVGSGAGGGVVAGELAKAGYKVIVLEKGVWYQEKEFSLLEKEGFELMYENGALMSTEDSGISIYAGSTFGGGTTINWCASFRTPDVVLQEWSKEHGLKFFTTPDYQRSMDAVCQRLGVHDDQTVDNSCNQACRAGSEKLGFHSATIPRNAPGAHSCGWCCFGCKAGEKHGMIKTFLQDAAESGNARFITGCYVNRIIHERGKAIGIEATLSNGCKIAIRSKVTVSSAGSIHSPALLLRSKIPNANIGKNLRLHPVLSVGGLTDKETQPFSGSIMTWYSDQVGNLDGHHYGAKLENPAVHPGTYAVALPWNRPEEFKRRALDFNKSVFSIALCRDKGSGQVKIDAKGAPKLYYPLSDFDKKSLVEGVCALVKILVASGCKEVYTSHELFPTLKITSTNVNAPEVKRYLEALRKVGVPEFRVPVFSAHQMGTCRMGSSASTSVLNANGESWEVKNLFVADASTFPTSSGVNPMITTESIAHYIAQKIKAKLMSNASKL